MESKNIQKNWLINSLGQTNYSNIFFKLLVTEKNKQQEDHAGSTFNKKRQKEMMQQLAILSISFSFLW